MKSISVADFWFGFVVITIFTAIGVAIYNVVIDEQRCSNVLHGTYMNGKCLDVRQLK